MGLSTPAGRMLARAIQDYGGYATDLSFSAMNVFVEPLPGAKAFADQLINAPAWEAADLKKIRQHLRIITNNTPQTPNGGTLDAARRAPLLPCSPDRESPDRGSLATSAPRSPPGALRSCDVARNAQAGTVVCAPSRRRSALDTASTPTTSTSTASTAVDSRP